ncbi:intracellular protein transport protein (Sat1) [Metarhizium album ARSEF 1941]|uniref:Intracellular protein transport protein (Sat1) n=1 Tax=Metarhizium album (strain ARSEF 1941) TaxID=1081103 RepID=A0A0B2WW82_METAS|nr:intracellular protein transport protein (Sat1) [Metarhizium album ARSEF 1941]KHN98298.1 intracellular protein transport protein (Sat1) [Metarhizium album ARSEF 1941]
MPPDIPSNIRVFVRWRDQTVFAGEDVKCTVTFKNAASTSSQQRQQQKSQQQQKPQGERQRLAVPLQSRAKASVGMAAPPPTTSTRGHRRSALSLGVSSTSSHSRSASVKWSQDASGGGDWRPGHAQRSLSIISIGSANNADEHVQRNESQSLPRTQRSHRGHNRATSLQISAHGATSPGPAGPQSAPFFPRHMSSPHFNSSYPPDRFGRIYGASTAPDTPGLGGQARSPARREMPNFRFPASPATANEEAASPKLKISDRFHSPKQVDPRDYNNLTVRPKGHPPSAVDRPAARILASNTIPGGTPRSSGEFYPMSNNSSETLVSEYVTQPLVRGNGRPPHVRRSSGMTSQQEEAPESLMMGYAQIQGSFTLDGSLVSLGPFESVKKKGAVGGRGGGVVGLEQAKRDAGLLKGFGWGNITTSLGGFLGGEELSTIKETRGAVNSKSIPLLSMPQSILFVDLQLAPGESRSYEYTFRLPKGLPPSHKGKTIKISYSLVIGTQRAGGAKEQQVKSVEVPFRVLGSVNNHGEILGHDLMSPYILLRDVAEVKSLGKHAKVHKPRASFGTPATMNEFLNYVSGLAAKRQDSAGDALLSPTESTARRRPSTCEEAGTAKEAIHLAIMRSNMAGDGQQSANRFEIARNGQRVGVVMLTRPAYRLGEVVTMAIDFTDADIACYAVHATLETTEKVDPSLATRSESSLQRVTRKVYVASSEAAMYSRRVVFTPTIPISATPEFVTTGVNLEWKIRVEFVVPYQGSDTAQPAELQVPHPLLEQISQDEKGGLVLVAMENLTCESFDISVPLRVYGAVGSGLERLERDEASEEGLAV